MKKEPNRQRIDITLSQEAHRLLNALAKKLGISRSAVLELAVREKAEREKVS